MLTDAAESGTYVEYLSHSLFLSGSILQRCCVCVEAFSTLGCATVRCPISVGHEGRNPDEWLYSSSRRCVLHSQRSLDLFLSCFVCARHGVVSTILADDRIRSRFKFSQSFWCSYCRMLIFRLPPRAQVDTEMDLPLAMERPNTEGVTPDSITVSFFAPRPTLPKMKIQRFVLQVLALIRNSHNHSRRRPTRVVFGSSRVQYRSLRLPGVKRRARMMVLLRNGKAPVSCK